MKKKILCLMGLMCLFLVACTNESQEKVDVIPTPISTKKPINNPTEVPIIIPTKTPSPEVTITPIPTETPTPEPTVIPRDDISLLTDTWQDFQVYIGGKIIELPITYQEFVNITGISNNEIDGKKDVIEGKYFPAGYSKTVEVKTSSNESCTLFLLNNTDEKRLATECLIVGVTQEINYADMYGEGDIDNDDAYVIFPKKLFSKKLISEQELLDLFGEPSLVERLAKAGAVDLYWHDDSDNVFKKSFYIRIKEGSISIIRLKLIEK